MRTMMTLTCALILAGARPGFAAVFDGSAKGPELEQINSGSIPRIEVSVSEVHKEAVSSESSRPVGRAGINELSLKDVGLRTLNYVLDEQKAGDQGKIYLKGEWPTQIQSAPVLVLAGAGKLIGKDEEATAFTTAFVANNLSRMFLDNWESRYEYPFTRIPQAVQNAVNTYERYREGPTYNFFPPLISNGVKVRRPVDMTIAGIYNGFLNIPNDADTTAVVLASLVYNARINKASFQVPQEALDTISRFVDSDRNPMFYNRFLGLKRTGAFMTWLMDENDPAMPRKYFSKPEAGGRIPFNKNDVDCVVNANVLTLLSLVRRSDLPGQADACAMLNNIIQKDLHAKCGIYYPNTFNLSYSLALARKEGLQCITKDSAGKVIAKILASQNANGSWLNSDNIWQDPVITTSFALYALLNLPPEDNGEPDQRIYASLVYGVHYLLQNAIQKDKYVFWRPDNFFTAVAAARGQMMWSSKAYTNSIIAAVLLEMHKRYPQYKVENYVKLSFRHK